MNKNTLIVFCLSLIVITGCYEKIDFELDKKEFIIVDALIRSNSLNNSITISLLKEDDSTVEPITNAVVYIEGSDGVRYNLNHKHRGEYKLDEVLNNEEEYRLLFEIDEKVYASTYESFGSNLSNLERLDFEAEQEVFFNANGNEEIREVLDIYLTLSNPAEIYTLFEYEGVYKVESIKTEGNPYPNICWFRDVGVDFLKVTAGEGTQRIKFLRVIPTSKFRSYNLFIKNYSISENAYNFWRELEELRMESGGIFSAPPSIVKSNIKSVGEGNKIDVLGYFTLASFDSVRFNFNEQELPLELSDICLPVSDTIPDVCFDCSLRSDTISVNNPPQLWLNP